MRSGYLSSLLLASLFTSSLTAAACSGGEITTPTDPPVAGTLTVDASTGWVHVSLAAEGTVAVEEPTASDAWDIGFSATSVQLNGGTAGPGGVVGYCICQNAGASDAEILAMTPTSELGDFEAVTAATVDAATLTAGASAEAFTTHPWYKYNLAGDHYISPTFNVYLVKRGTRLYKLQLINYYGPAGESRRITFRYAQLGS